MRSARVYYLQILVLIIALAGLLFAVMVWSDSHCVR